MTENQPVCSKCGQAQICKLDEKKIEQIVDECLEKQKKKSEDSGWLGLLNI